MDDDTRRNQEAVERAERYLKHIPSHLLGPAGRVLLSNAPPTTTKQGPAALIRLRGIEGGGAERQSPSQRLHSTTSPDRRR